MRGGKGRYGARALSGFSLLELAITLGVISVLASLALPLVLQFEQAQQRRQAQQQLVDIKQALLQFLQVEGRLPCPATPSTRGREALLADGRCQQATGDVPAVTLAYVGRVNERLAVVNRRAVPLRYSVAQIDGQARLTDAARLADPTLEWSGVSGSIRLREHAASGCGESGFRADNVWALVLSAGLHDYPWADEQENRDPDQDFVAAPYNQRAGCAFDDRLIWLSKAELLSTVFGRRLAP